MTGLMNIGSSFTVPEGHTPKFGIGSYVRAKHKDLGTGQIKAVSQVTVLDDSEKVVHQVVYTVWWMDKVREDTKQRDVLRQHSEESLESSARGVQKFASQEEADAWMEKQTQAGNWTDAAQDTVNSESDADIELQQMLGEQAICACCSQPRAELKFESRRGDKYCRQCFDAGCPADSIGTGAGCLL